MGVMTKNVTLRGGNAAPWLAFGVGSAFLGKDVSEIAKVAISRGFRHLDGAQMYKNEASLGDAIAASGVPRSELFITTKLGPVDYENGQTVEDTFKESLKKLKLDYVDLFLIHLPTQHQGHLREVWESFVDLKSRGLVKNIGVSNFTISLLEEIASFGLELPAVNQMEFHPFLYTWAKPLLEYHAKHGIIIESYGGLSPIIPDRAFDEALKEPLQKLTAVLDKAAAARSTDGLNVTHNQVVLKWLEQHNVIAVTTSSKASRMDEYLATEDLPNLSSDEMEEFAAAIEGVHFRHFSKLTKYMDNQ